MCACKYKVSGSISLPARGSFHLSFTVLLHYRSPGSILAWRVVPPSSMRIPRVRIYSGYRSLALTSITGLSPSMVGLPIPFFSPLRYSMRSEPRWYFYLRFGRLPLSLAATRRISFDFFSSDYLDVSVRRVPFLQLCIHHRIARYERAGFPHSDIFGSMHICCSPKLIAACRVLLRLPVPRHSPCTLLRLNFLWFSYMSFANRLLCYYCS